MSSINELSFLRKFFRFVYPLGKPMSSHLLRCQGLAVDDYSFALGRLEAGATSTFAQLGWKVKVAKKLWIKAPVFLNPC
jgi:hypothetical protein